jgi:hypothetical protein
MGMNEETPWRLENISLEDDGRGRMRGRIGPDVEVVKIGDKYYIRCASLRFSNSGLAEREVDPSLNYLFNLWKGRNTDS